MPDQHSSPSPGGATATRPSPRAASGPGPDATTTTTTYQDVFVRDNFGDTGAIPSSGVPYRSPDIIPYQDNTLTFPTAISTYSGPDIGMSFQQGTPNNIYVRAQNLWPTGTETATAQLFYAPTSLFLSPSQWTQNVIQTADNLASVSFVNQNGSTQLSPNDICLTQEAFYLASLPPVASGAHYCLIAVVTTPNNTITIPSSFSSNAAFVQWVQQYPGVAWRNISIIPAAPGSFSQTMTFGSDDSDAAEFHFSVLGNSMPTGTTVTVQSTAAQCSFTQTLTLPAPDSLGNQLTGFDQVLPGNFTAGLSMTATPPSGSSFSDSASLDLIYYEYPPAEMTDLHRQVGRFRTIARAAADGAGAAVTAFLIQVGQCSFVVESPSS